jgi:hypothetical protein
MVWAVALAPIEVVALQKGRKLVSDIDVVQV